MPFQKFFLTPFLPFTFISIANKVKQKRNLFSPPANGGGGGQQTGDQKLHFMIHKKGAEGEAVLPISC